MSKRECLDCGKLHDFDKEIYCDCHLERAIRECKIDIANNSNTIEGLVEDIKNYKGDNALIRTEIARLQKRLEAIND